MNVFLLILLLAAGALAPTATGSADPPASTVPETSTPSEDMTIAAGEPLTEAEYSRQLTEITTPVSTELVQLDRGDPERVQAAFDTFDIATQTVEGMTPPPARTEDHAMLVGAMRQITSDLNSLLQDPGDADAQESLAQGMTFYGEALDALGIVP